jgi:pimeloyl-ACP methyl ester carboxylesterase
MAMVQRSVLARVARVTGLVVLGAAVGIWAWVQWGPRRVSVSAGSFPEELVFARSRDDVINGGAAFTTPNPAVSGVAVVWVHGWGVNFYHPTYVSIARRLAERGVPAILVNTRMHDLATSATYREGRRVRGGGYWGIPSEEALDIAAWIDLVDSRGFDKVVLVGHSAGWAAVARYQATRKDPRVAGLVLASGTVQPQQPLRDPALVAEATKHVESGRGDDLLRLPGRSFPSFISAATWLDQANTPPEMLDFFGLEHESPAIREISVPLLALFGTRGDVGGEADLAAVAAAVSRHRGAAVPVETRMIQLGDHMYTGEEAQVATVLAGWISRTIK